MNGARKWDTELPLSNQFALLDECNLDGDGLEDGPHCSSVPSSLLHRQQMLVLGRRKLVDWGGKLDISFNQLSEFQEGLESPT